MTRYAAIALALFAGSSAAAAEKTLDRTFAVSAGGTLVVDADSASVRVTGGNSNQVVVHMVAKGSDENLAEARLEAVQEGNGVTVTMRRKDQGSFWRRSWSGDWRIEVTVPRKYEVRAKTSGGSVELTDTVGTATLSTSGGEIVAKNLDGRLEARTSGGGIFAETIRGDVDANTSGGDVRLLRVDGRIKARTSGGSVECSLVGANRGISASTSGGSIDLRLPKETTANVRATTSGGGISSELPIAASEMGDNNLRGTLNGGGQVIEASTSGGSITLRAD